MVILLMGGSEIEYGVLTTEGCKRLVDDYVKSECNKWIIQNRLEEIRGSIEQIFIEIKSGIITYDGAKVTIQDLYSEKRKLEAELNY